MSTHSWRDLRIVRTLKSLIKSFYVTLGVFLVLFVVLHIARTLYIFFIAEKTTKAFELGIEKDLAHLKKQGDELAMDSRIHEYILKRDSEKLIKLTKSEITLRNVGLIGVIDSNGGLLSRTKSTGNLGINVFLTNPVGRLMAKGESAQSVEATVGFDPRQIFLTTGRPVIKDGNMIGGLTANYLTDDAYAAEFSKKYLPKGSRLVFYNKNAGVYGNSFNDPERRKIVNSYFNSGSEWVRGDIHEKTVFFENGGFYLVKNIIFPGLEGSPGGALIFIPRREVSQVVNFTAAFLIASFFLFFAWRYHLHYRGEKHGLRYYIFLLVISVPLLFLAFFTLQLQNRGYLKLQHIPYTLYNSTLRIQPDFGVYESGLEQKFSVVVDTGDESINVVSLGLLFDPEAVEIKALETASSTCTYIIENIIDSEKGRIDLSCAVLKFGGENGSLSVADVVLMPKRTGTFTLSFDLDSTQVLASDGLGTNVLRAAANSSYQVDDFDPQLSLDTNSISATSTKKSFIIFSPTHPNKSRWYNTKSAQFVWKGRVGALYRYVFDSSPETVPLQGTTTTGSSVRVAIPDDGIFYFHLQLASGGPVVHYRVQVDTVPPNIVSFNMSSARVFAGDVVRFFFDAKDTGSGVQKNYYVDLGNHLFLPIGNQLFIPFLEAGEQKVTLRVYDDANNYTEKTQIIYVEKP